MATSSPPTSQDEAKKMLELWPNVLEDLTGLVSPLNLPDVTSWVSQLLQYNVPHGKMIRGVSVIQSYKILAKPHQLTEDNLRLARILGWCAEIFQSFFLVQDDIMDHSQTRRGRPCWYLQPNVGLTAVNDSLLLEQFIYQLLWNHFQKQPCYLDLLRTFQQNVLNTAVGQMLDMLSNKDGEKPNLDFFTMERYEAIVKHKAAYYTLVMPVSLAMQFAGLKDPEMYRQATEILMKLGQMFQVQDDFLDCYGDPGVTGKVGTDVQEGKCTWLAVMAVQKARDDQRRILEECYGEKDEEKVTRVKKLYEEMELRQAFLDYEKMYCGEINKGIREMSCGLPRELFLRFLDKLYNRKA